MRGAPALILGLAGCAVAPLPPPELLDAQRVLARAAASPFAPEAAAEITAAEALLTQAEREHEAHPGSARAADGAYVALRAAEKAVIAGRYAADRIALEKARGAAFRLAADLERRDAFLASLARRHAAQAAAQAALREAHRGALERARGPMTQIVERPDALVFRLSPDELFLPGTSLLRDGAEPRLAALCHCLGERPPYAVRLAILCDVEGFKTAPAILAARRLARVQEALRAHGVPEEAFLPPERHPPPGTQIDVMIVEPALPLPADE
ncbi:MAG: hypothetical protein QM820_24850 [Minicystis sp.]